MKWNLIEGLSSSMRLLTLAMMGASAVTVLAAGYEKTDKGVVVHVTQRNADGTSPQLVRLQVMGEKIMRVSATAEGCFADRPSLIIVDRPLLTPYEVREDSGVVCVSTAQMKGFVRSATGEVWFTDAAGKLIASDRKGGGKTFAPYRCRQVSADGKPVDYSGWTMRQVFENLDDSEALYGLGQHQADEWNYKGRNEELFQYNTKVSIPFIVSSNNYGILLDNYSLSRFGNPKDYSQLHEVFTLRDKEGKAGALTGTYSAPGEETLVRREDSIYFENLRSAKHLPKFPLDKATVVYEGTITPHKTGIYRFSHYYSGYQKVFVGGLSAYTEDVAGKGGDGQEIWRTAWNPNARKFAFRLREGKTYTIRIEWKPDGGEAYCGLRALEPVDEAEQRRLSFWSEMGQQMDYYFMLGENADEVISAYRTLTGKAQIMPDWLFGYWQSRERYKTQDEIVDALGGFRQRHLPIDNIVMDWNYWTPDSWGAFTFDPSRFSSPKKMIDDIHAQNAKIMISCWPKYYLTVDNYHELNNKGMIYQQSVKDSLYDWLGYKYAFYDAYDEDARKIFWRQLYENLGTIGMDAWWMDASEPNVRDCTDMDYRKLLCGPTKYGSSDEYFNAYSIVNAEAIYDGQRGYETAIEKLAGGSVPDSKWLEKNAAWNQRGFGNSFSPENRRVFLLTRNGFASEQRYSTATWSGDIGTRWEDMKAQITAGLNFSISGVPYWSQDIGGFSVEKRYAEAQEQYEKTGVENEDLKEWRELNARWHQLGMFAPMYRSHGQFPFREPWNIAPEGHPAYEVISSCLQLRYRLLPYIYSIAAQVHFNDYTMMRPLVMDFGDDAKAREVAYQFMFGPAIMVNPVYKYGQRHCDVYFPKDNVWYDFYTGKVLTNGNQRLRLSAPYERIPLCVRAGSIIPVGPALEYVKEKKADVIRLFVYQGKDGKFTLYEDEGDNYGYEAGRYSNIEITYDDAKKIVTIGDRKGEFPGMLKERTFIIVPVSSDRTQGYDPEAQGVVVKYQGTEIVTKL